MYMLVCLFSSQFIICTPGLKGHKWYHSYWIKYWIMKGSELEKKLMLLSELYLYKLIEIISTLGNSISQNETNNNNNNKAIKLLENWRTQYLKFPDIFTAIVCLVIEHERFHFLLWPFWFPLLQLNSEWSIWLLSVSFLAKEF